tara:strand:+ start:452 stop:565 length:114 start_codon:yes stop_codon:yes gene_type:complete
MSFSAKSANEAGVVLLCTDDKGMTKKINIKLKLRILL